ncbi:MAG: atoC [Gemmatimonadetes bacterium]|nr:atoC [Gemmatimonadota bacterium]
MTQRSLAGDQREISASAATVLCPAASLDFARLAAASAYPILLSGETGSGKTHLARAIHEMSVRRSWPFVAVNCGAIPEQLFEREMFGHVRGAFTDARESQPGVVEGAHRGTLLLDEIGETPPATQAKLLSVYEDGVIRRLGATVTVAVDVRMVAATNASLEQLVARRLFRADLFHRCAVLEHHLAPLRERREELPLIIETLLRRIAGPAAPLPAITADAYALIAEYDWPGNLRELDNALRRAVVHAGSGAMDAGHLPDRVRRPVRLAASAPTSKMRRYAAPADRGGELLAIQTALLQERGNRTHAARRLGMSRSTLWAKLRHGLPEVRVSGNGATAVTTAHTTDTANDRSPVVQTPFKQSRPSDDRGAFGAADDVTSSNS